MLWGLSQIELTHGRARAARTLCHRAREEADRDGSPRNCDFELALWETEVGNGKLALAALANVPTAGFNKNDRLRLAMTYARAGETTRATELADRLAAEYPLDTLVQKYGIPVIRAASKLHEKDAAAAVEILRPTLPYDLGNSEALDELYPAYIRGLAYLELRQGRSAAAEFQKVLDHPGFVGRGPLIPLSRLHLARALLTAGDPDGAGRSDEQFLRIGRTPIPTCPSTSGPKPNTRHSTGARKPHPDGRRAAARVGCPRRFDQRSISETGPRVDFALQTLAFVWA